MMKSLRKWLKKSGYNPGKIKLFGGGEALEVSTPYQGQTPTAEQFATLAEIRRHVSRHYAGIKVEPRGFYSSIYIYYKKPERVPAFCRALFLLLVGVRPAAVLLFRKSPAVCLRYKKTKGCFYPAGFVPVWFGCKNT